MAARRKVPASDSWFRPMRSRMVCDLASITVLQWPAWLHLLTSRTAQTLSAPQKALRKMGLLRAGRHGACTCPCATRTKPSLVQVGRCPRWCEWSANRSRGDQLPRWCSSARRQLLGRGGRRQRHLHAAVFQLLPQHAKSIGGRATGAFARARCAAASWAAPLRIPTVQGGRRRIGHRLDARSTRAAPNCPRPTSAEAVQGGLAQAVASAQAFDETIPAPCAPAPARQRPCTVVAGLPCTHPAPRSMAAVGGPKPPGLAAPQSRGSCWRSNSRSCRPSANASCLTPHCCR